MIVKGLNSENWRPQRDSNPRYRLERAKGGAWQVLENAENAFDYKGVRPLSVFIELA